MADQATIDAKKVELEAERAATGGKSGPTRKLMREYLALLLE